ncbi:MAG: glycosyltransferase [Promicromonosporaceae bacterium]|nr:glycosyltransferase [Promicromonosporaceae bacterium]
MKILLVCPFFPPENRIAAVRVAKFAKFWAQEGHEVRVLTRNPLSEGLEVPESSRITTVRVPDPIGERVERAQGRVVKAVAARPSLFIRVLAELYRRALALVWPDLFIAWTRNAVREAKGWEWKPDVVVSSVGPVSAVTVGSRLSHHWEVPLVVDYRDLLSSSTYYPHGWIRRVLDTAHERRQVRDAALLVSVSQPLADELHQTYGIRAETVLNGYDPEDFRDLPVADPSDTLSIVHCGYIYPDLRRDPRPFLTAIRQVLDGDPTAPVRVEFYGPPSAIVTSLVNELGLGHVVTQHGRVTNAESLAVQATADLLLLLLWNDPGERGVYSGKVFEYVGIGHSIVMTGYENGVAAELIRDHSLGVTSNDSAIIAGFLRDKLTEKRRDGQLADPIFNEKSSLTREVQSLKLLGHLEEVVRTASGTECQDSLEDSSNAREYRD